MFGKKPKSVFKDHKSLENALELAAYKCDFKEFCNFIEKVEDAIVNRKDTYALEQEILEVVNAPRTRSFNIHKIANDPTLNVKDQTVA